MMSDALRAMRTFLEQTGLPVHRSGEAPGGTAIPHVTFDMTPAGFGQSAPATVTGWFRDASAHADAAAFLDKMAALVPEAGVKLPLPRGYLLLERGESFLSLHREQEALAGRAALAIRWYAVGEASVC